MLRNINRLIFPVLTALAAVPVEAHAGASVESANCELAAGIALGGRQLSDAQMDRVTAGQVLGTECPGCPLSSSSSMSTNGTTTNMSSTGVTPGGGATGGSGGGSGDSGSGSSGSGAGGGSGGGAGAGASGGGGPNIPNLSTSTPQLSAKIIAIITAASTPAIINP